MQIKGEKGFMFIVKDTEQNSNPDVLFYFKFKQLCV